jgi:hypothetical protein
MQRSGMDKVIGRGRSMSSHSQVWLARALNRQRAVADGCRWATQRRALFAALGVIRLPCPDRIGRFLSAATATLCIVQVCLLSSTAYADEKARQGLEIAVHGNGQCSLVYGLDTGTTSFKVPCRSVGEATKKRCKPGEVDIRVRVTYPVGTGSALVDALTSLSDAGFEKFEFPRHQ